jgi:hypothetical protein
MPSREVYEKFLVMGFPVDKLSYLKYDALESNSDLEALFEVLTSVKDSNGNHPVFTANTIMTNPDFDKIRQSGFRDYHYELFTETLKRYPEHDKVMDLYRVGIEKNVFYPQLHGREHLNINRWMKAIQDEKSNARLAFDYGFYDLATSHTKISQDSFVDALNISNTLEIKEHNNSIKEATNLFNAIFGYPSISFIAPCYIWSPELEPLLFDSGIKVLQGNSYQLIPKAGRVNVFQKRLHFTGEKNKNNLRFTIRNCYFEPSSKNYSNNEIYSCLDQIESAFKYHKPAIITSHRINYIGFIDESNRSQGLKMIESLLKQIILQWPDVEFISSAKLFELMDASYG